MEDAACGATRLFKLVLMLLCTLGCPTSQQNGGMSQTGGTLDAGAGAPFDGAPSLADGGGRQPDSGLDEVSLGIQQVDVQQALRVGDGLALAASRYDQTSQTTAHLLVQLRAGTVLARSTAARASLVPSVPGVATSTSGLLAFLGGEGVYVFGPDGVLRFSGAAPANVVLRHIAFLGDDLVLTASDEQNQTLHLLRSSSTGAVKWSLALPRPSSSLAGALPNIGGLAVAGEQIAMVWSTVTDDASYQDVYFGLFDGDGGGLARHRINRRRGAPLPSSALRG